jgi:hypothetical protein
MGALFYQFKFRLNLIRQDAIKTQRAIRGVRIRKCGHCLHARVDENIRPICACEVGAALYLVIMIWLRYGGNPKTTIHKFTRYERHGLRVRRNGLADRPASILLILFGKKLTTPHDNI